MKSSLDYRALEDRQLIELHQGGDGQAFQQIVERHQGVVCAVAYCACGDVGRSEDIAQEAFVAAWKQLPQLREPEKLRSWLCGITRNLAHNAVRHAQRTPTADAYPLSPDLPADAAGPRELAIGADEAALMWSALAALPETYREPMVLFYRQGRSTAAVAAALEISEDTARQRLARGREMLSVRMAKIVEESLARSAPSAAFAGMVSLALAKSFAPITAEAIGGGAAVKTVATSTAIGSAAVKTGLAIKLLSALAFLPAVLQGTLDFRRFEARNKRQENEVERRRAAWAYLAMNVSVGLAIVGLIVFDDWLPFKLPFKIAFILTWMAGFLWLATKARQRMERSIPADPADALFAKPVARAIFESRSRTLILGLPLYHARLCFSGKRRSPPVKAWLAMSDGYAVGGLFACAPVAVAPMSVGLISLAVFSFGLLAVGGWSLGAVAAGWLSAGFLAAGGYAAKGMVTIAPHFADGLAFVAVHANDAAAKEFFRTHWFYRLGSGLKDSFVWAGLFSWVMPVVLGGLVPAVLSAWRLWRTRARGKG